MGESDGLGGAHASDEESGPLTATAGDTYLGQLTASTPRVHTLSYNVLQCSMYKWHRVLTKAALARSFRRPPTHINLNQVCSHVIAEGITTPPNCN